MKKKSIGLLIVILLIWSFPPVLIKYLDFSFSPFTQNFYRYLISALFLLLFEYIFYKKDLLICLKKIKLFLVPALTITLYQTFFTLGIILSQANTCAFLSKISGVFVILLACLFLPEERSIIREKNFILGFIITFSSTAAITLSKGKVNFSLGSSLLVLSMFFWALYTVEIKQILKKTKIKEVAAVSFVLSLATLFLFFPAIPRIKEVFQAPLMDNLILFISGFVCIGLAGTIYYLLLRKIGATITVNSLLLTSFITVVLSFFFLKEKITLLQFIAGIFLILGCYFILKASNNTGKEGNY